MAKNGRVRVSLKKEIHKEVKKLGVDLGMTLQEIMDVATIEWLRRNILKGE